MHYYDLVMLELKLFTSEMFYCSILAKMKHDPRKIKYISRFIRNILVNDDKVIYMFYRATRRSGLPDKYLFLYKYLIEDYLHENKEKILIIYNKYYDYYGMVYFFRDLLYKELLINIKNNTTSDFCDKYKLIDNEDYKYNKYILKCEIKSRYYIDNNEDDYFIDFYCNKVNNHLNNNLEIFYLNV